MNAFQLPEIPQQPSATPPTDAAQIPIWQTQWANYRWAVEQHAHDACRQGWADLRVAILGAIDDSFTHLADALRQRREVTKAEVVLEAIRVVPPAIRPTEGAWAGDVMLVADALWARMQQDTTINPPPPTA